MKYIKIFIAVVVLIMPFYAMALSNNQIFTTDYYYEGDNPLDYPYKSDIYKEIISTDLNDEKEYKLNRLFEEVDIYSYKELEKIDRINIRQNSNLDFNIENVKIYYDNNEISYKYICSSCYGYAIATFNKEFVYESNNDIEKNAVLEIILNKEYEPSKLKVLIKYKNSSINNLTKVDVVYYKYANDNRYLLKPVINNISEYIMFSIDDFRLPSELLLKKENIINYKYESKSILSYFKLNENFYKLDNVSTKYRYIDKLYLYYKMEEGRDDNSFKDHKVISSVPMIKNIETKLNENKTIVNNCLNVSGKISNKKIDDRVNFNKKNKLSNKKVTSKSKIYKYQQIIIVIIIIILFLMGYMIYCLKKE